jgi:acetate kinase
MTQKTDGDRYQVKDIARGKSLRLLIFNPRSLALRYDWFDTADPARRLKGEVRGIGLPQGSHRLCGAGFDRRETATIRDHRQAVEQALQWLSGPGGAGVDLGALSAVGHQVLYGSGRYGSAVVVDDDVRREIGKVGFDSGEHQARLAAMDLARERLAGVPHVAVFDTAFFQNLPQLAQLYALPLRYFHERGVRRLGFFGLSHKFALFQAAAFLDRPGEWLKVVTVHLGNGTSLAAIDHGRPVDTTMGLTPYEGPPMAVRSGDLDPGLLLYLMREEKLDPAAAAKLIGEHGGLAGLSGLSGDIQDILEAAERGHDGAQLAVQVYCHRVRKAIGAMVASLGGCDALVFTGGAGATEPGIRTRICHGLGHLGVVLDAAANARGLAEGQEVAAVDHEASRARVLLVRPDEARMLARETVRALGREDIDQRLRSGRQRPIPIGVSAHHVHLTREHVEVLFGPRHRLTQKAPLYQTGEFACEETVDLVGPKGKVERVRVLGPERKQSQVEISRTEEFKLGIDAPIRDSGDLDGTPGITLAGPAASLPLRQGVICARRHIHMSPAEAEELSLRDRDVVRVRVEGPRSLTFGDVLIRVKDSYRLEMHIDTDEANAAEIGPDMVATLDGIQSRPG